MGAAAQSHDDPGKTGERHRGLSQSREEDVVFHSCGLLQAGAGE
jgi:hypothetical protein